MQQKQVLVNGEQMGVILHNRKPIMTFNMLATAFGILPKKVGHIFYKHRTELQPPLSYFIDRAQAKRMGFDVGTKRSFRVRVFTQEAVEYLQEKFIRATSGQTYTAVIEDYFQFGAPAEEESATQIPVEEYEMPWPSMKPGFKPGVILPPLAITAKQKDDESDEVLDLAIKIVADRQRTKHIIAELEHQKAAANCYKAALSKIFTIINTMEFQI